MKLFQLIQKCLNLIKKVRANQKPKFSIIKGSLAQT